MRKHAQQSLLDYLIDHLGPAVRIIDMSNMVDGRAANALYEIWKDHKNHVSGHVYKKPTTLSADVLETMQKEGLVRDIGGRLEVTAKGSEVIRTMILGDDRSVWEDNGDTKDYKLAYKHTKTPSLKKQGKKYEAAWWGRQKMG